MILRLETVQVDLEPGFHLNENHVHVTCIGSGFSCTWKIHLFRVLWNEQEFKFHITSPLQFSLNQTLQWPFKEVCAKALYDFNPKELNQLPLRKDCIVLVIGKEGDSKGWWRGKALDRVC